MNYITYEEPFKGKTFSEEEMEKIYLAEVDKNEYSTYDYWLTDMLKSGVFEKVEDTFKKTSMFQR